MINRTEKGILVTLLGDTLCKLIYHHLCKIQRIWWSKRDFIRVLGRNIKDTTSYLMKNKSKCSSKFYATKSHQANKQISVNIKIENMLQWFRCTSFSFKQPLLFRYHFSSCQLILLKSKFPSFRWKDVDANNNRGACYTSLLFLKPSRTKAHSLQV